MVHSIEFTKIWTNIYSKTHPQRKHFSSKQVTYRWQSLYAQTSLNLMGSLLCKRREVRRDGQGKKKKPPALWKQRFVQWKWKHWKKNEPTHFWMWQTILGMGWGFLGTGREQPLTGWARWGQGGGEAGPGGLVPSHLHPLILWGEGKERGQPLGGCTSNLNQSSLQTTHFFMWKINISLVAQLGRKPQTEEKVAAVPRSHPCVFMPLISSTLTLKPVGTVSNREGMGWRN